MKLLSDYLTLINGRTTDNIFVDAIHKYILRLLDILFGNDSEEQEEIFATHSESYRQLSGKAAKYKLVNTSRGDEPFVIHGADTVQQIFNDPLIQEILNNKQFYSRHRIETPDQLHHTICKHLFQEIERAENQDKSVWIQIDHDDSYDQESTPERINNSESTNYIRLAILSEEVLRYDASIFNLLREENEQVRQLVRESYRPYFLEFYADTRDMNRRQRNFFSNPENYGTWFRANFTSEEAGGEDGMVFEGVYASSASPVKYKRKKLEIEDKQIPKAILDKINDTYSLKGEYCSDDKKIAEALKDIFDKVIFHKVRVYRVGNGNCVYSYGKVGKKEKRLLYDVGFDNNTAVSEKIQKIPNSYQSSVNSIRQFLPDCVILSHWDADHYKACAYCRKELFECKWIAPDYKDASSNAKRLGTYLYLINNMFFVDRSVSRAIEIDLSKNSRLTLYIGKHAEKISKPNCEGIAIRHENGLYQNSRIRCLMQGDVTYKSLPAQACFAGENPYDYLIAPHHGSEMDYSLLQAKTSKDGYAVICCNNNTTKVKNRPANDHLAALRNCYNEVEVTESAKTYIQFNLKQKNSVRKA